MRREYRPSFSTFSRSLSKREVNCLLTQDGAWELRENGLLAETILGVVAHLLIPTLPYTHACTHAPLKSELRDNFITVSLGQEKKKGQAQAGSRA